jgi:hypothetical protein
VGSAFRALVDPERQISEAADRLVAPGRSFLCPKLTWSRNRLRAFIEQPQHFLMEALRSLTKHGGSTRAAVDD